MSAEHIMSQKLGLSIEQEEELAHAAMFSFDMDIGAFLLDPENFDNVTYRSLMIPRPSQRAGGVEFKAKLLSTTKEFFSSWHNRAYLALAILFLIMVIFFSPKQSMFSLAEIKLHPPDQVTPTPPPKKTPPPTPTPQPTPPPTPTPKPLDPIKLNKPKENLKVKLQMQQRQERQVSAATAKLFVRNTAETAAPDIDAQFTTSRTSDPNVAVNLENLGAGRKGGNAKEGASIGAIGGSRHGSEDGTADKVTIDLGKKRGTGQQQEAGVSGKWVRVPIAGAIAQLQLRCHNKEGYQIVGNIRIQCSSNVIVAAWKRM